MVLKAVKRGECALDLVMERVGWRWRVEQKVDTSLRRLVKAGAITQRYESCPSGGRQRVFSCAEGA